MLRWAVRLDAIDAGVVATKPPKKATARARPVPDLAARLGMAAEAAEYRVDRLLARLAPPPPAKRAALPKEL
jgi:hypothetical protein